MSYLMKLFGLIFLVAGIALVTMAFVFPGRLDVYGVQLDTAANLLVGGVLALGLSGVMDALRGRGKTSRDVEVPVAAATIPPPAPASEKKPELPSNPFNRKAAASGAAVAAVVTVATAAVADPVAETISALDQAKADIASSMNAMDAFADPEQQPDLVEEDVVVEEFAEGDLYVVEERVVRGRPARILSDETVEAETDEGWMRFENLEHLNEYLDSVEEAA